MVYSFYDSTIIFHYKQTDGGGGQDQAHVICHGFLFLSVLTLNCFTFSGEIFKQINGVAMGTKMGPNYANLFVGYVE